MCDKNTTSSNTTIRITKKGREIIIYHCSDCGRTIEVERIRSTIRIKNKRS